jgi:lipoprotein-releasing system permease protein
MNWPFFIARRLIWSRQRSFSKLIVRLATAGVALSVAVMLISLATVTGFRDGIRQKVTGFTGHLAVNALNNNNSLEQVPILRDSRVEESLWKMPRVEKVSAIAQKPGIIKGAEDLDGIVLKGVDAHYDWTFLKEALVEGRLPKHTDSAGAAEVLISRYTAKRLKLKPGEKLRVLFISADSAGNNTTSAVAPRISGIYETGLEEQDRLMAFTSLSLLQRVYRHPDVITQWEIRLKQEFLDRDPELLRRSTEFIHTQIPAGLRAWNIFEQQPQIFEWLGYLDTNVEIIIVLMVVVASINMCIALMILLLERTNMIGLLKAFGAADGPIRRIFLTHAAFIILGGLALGNLFGLGFCFLQERFAFIRLPRETYYVDRMLVEIVPMHVALVNAGTFVLILLVLFIPAAWVSRLSPVKTIKFN